MNDTNREWRPKNRPQSTVAQNFSAALDELFRIDGGIEAMASNVDKKKQTLDTQSRELEALEARLRETEARLKRANSQSPSRSVNRHASQRHTPVRGVSFPDRHYDPRETAGARTNGEPTSPLARHEPRGVMEEGQASAGAAAPRGMVDRNGEYVMVDRPQRGREPVRDGRES